MGMFDEMFGFGEQPAIAPKEVKADLLTRIRDLELAVVGHNLDAPKRIHKRLDQSEATPEQRAAFKEAFCTDLEIAHLHNLTNKDVPAKNNWRGTPAVKGHQSISAAIMGYGFAQEQLWEWAKTMFKQANGYATSFWGRSHAACEAIVDTINQEPATIPVAVETIERLYESLEVIPSGLSHLEASTEATTLLEWFEHWHAFCKTSRAFKGLINDEILEAVKAGEWERLISYERQDPDGVSVEPKTIVVKPSAMGVPDEAPRTLLGKHLRTLTDSDAKAQSLRIWKHVWWGAGFVPDFASKYNCGYDLRQREDGLWYLDHYENKSEYKEGKFVRERVWGRRA